MACAHIAATKSHQTAPTTNTLKPESPPPHRSLDFSNIVASCNRSKQCGRAHAHKVLPLTSLMDECETELKFYLSGRVEGLSPRAVTSIQVLNLGDCRENNRALFGARKSILDALLYDSGMEGDDLEVADFDLLTLLKEELEQPDTNNRLKPFSPVLVNVIRQLGA